MPRCRVVRARLVFADERSSLMCGIFGMVGRRDHAGLREAALSLRHRGPDGFGEWSSPGRVAYLAHCRLSIIDLS